MIESLLKNVLLMGGFCVFALPIMHWAMLRGIKTEAKHKGYHLINRSAFRYYLRLYWMLFILGCIGCILLEILKTDSSLIGTVIFALTMVVSVDVVCAWIYEVDIYSRFYRFISLMLTFVAIADPFTGLLIGLMVILNTHLEITMARIPLQKE